jgi:uncharacterized protein (DUF2147 family)
MNLKSNLSFLICILAVSFIQAQTVLGKWKSIDDETGKPKSIVEIYEYQGKVYGKIVQLFRDPSEDQNPVCKECKDDRKDQLIVGMQIIRDMTLIDGYHKNGSICDPKSGKVYKCEMWLKAGDSNQLELRGYLGWFYRTQTWQRVQ